MTLSANTCRSGCSKGMGASKNVGNPSTFWAKLWSLQACLFVLTTSQDGLKERDWNQKDLGSNPTQLSISLGGLGKGIVSQLNISQFFYEIKMEGKKNTALNSLGEDWDRNTALLLLLFFSCTSDLAHKPIQTSANKPRDKLPRSDLGLLESETQIKGNSLTLGPVIRKLFTDLEGREEFINGEKQRECLEFLCTISI